MDEPTIAVAHRLLNLVRHDNISGVVSLAQRIETDVPELGIRLESEGGSVYLRFGDDRVRILREGPQQRVRYDGQFASEIETQKGRPVRVRIEQETILRLAAYVEGLAADEGD